jgi:RNAse (barnase) inhibitor barstar
MTTLSKLPPIAVLPLAGRDIRGLERETAAAGHRWLHADCAGVVDKAGVMSALARGWRLPKYFGANLDALYDCVTDLKPRRGAASPGLVLVVENLPEAAPFDEEQRDALIEVFRDAADDFAGRGIAFRVFYSLSADRPASP